VFEALGRHLSVFGEAWRHERTQKANRKAWSDHAFLPAALEVMERPASPAGRAMIWILVVFFVVAMGWAIFSHVDVVATATGKTLPRDRVKHIQASELGVVRAIHVEDGQRVTKDTALIDLDPTVAGAEEGQAEYYLRVAAVAAARVQALFSYLESGAAVIDPPQELSGPESLREEQLIASRVGEYEATLASLAREKEEQQAELVTVRTELAKLRETLPLVEEQLSARRELMEKGLSPKVLFLELQERYIGHQKNISIQEEQMKRVEASIRATESRAEQYRQEFRKELMQELTDAYDQIALRTAELEKASRRNALQQLASPVDGTVQQLAVHTIGGVVQPAEPLMVIVPDGGDLMVEAMILNKDIGSVEVGDPVEVKLEAFPFTKYGVIHGRLDSLSLDAIQDENLGLVYAARITLEQTHINVTGRDIPLGAGMAVTAEIKTGERRLIEFLLAPLLRYRDEALRER
jgi:hemolysin D